MYRPLIGVLLVLLTACATFPGAAEPEGDRATAAPAVTVTAPATSDEVACLWGIDEGVQLPEQLREDGLRLASKPAVPLAEAMDWDDPPHDHESWHFALHNLRWTYPLVTAAASGDDGAAELVDEIYTSWLEINADPADAPVEQTWFAHTVALRTQVATCAVHLLGLDSAKEVLTSGLDWLRLEENFDGLWNHGVDQSIALLMGGCALGDGDAVGVAVDRLDQHRREAIDEQGVTNEQATKYQQFVRNQYKSAVQVMEACGLDAARFREARTAMLPMLVHATRPRGTLAPLGDSYTSTSGVAPDAHPDAPAGAPGPPEATVTYERGYAFGRDEWGETGTWFGLRFGEGRIIHGHRDHASLVYDVHGSPVLTEAGFSGYQPGPWRDWERSHIAHNVVAVDDGGRFLWDNETPLVHEDITDDAASLTVAGRPYTAIEEHRRAVLVSFAPHAVIIHDTVTAPAPVDTHQLWHLPAEWEVVEQAADETIAAGPDGLGLRVLQLATVAPPTVIEGQQEPIQGFVATGPDERTAAPVLDHPSSGTRVEYLTVLVPTGEGLPEVTVTRDGDELRLATADLQVTVHLVDGNLVLRR